MNGVGKDMAAVCCWETGKNKESEKINTTSSNNHRYCFCCYPRSCLRLSPCFRVVPFPPIQESLPSNVWVENRREVECLSWSRNVGSTMVKGANLNSNPPIIFVFLISPHTTTLSIGSPIFTSFLVQILLQFLKSNRRQHYVVHLVVIF